MEITQKVKAIGHLDRVWRACCRTARIVRRAITGNDFDPWVCTQPRRHRLCGALGQQIDRPLLLEIDQDRAIDPALTEGKIIDAEHPRRWLGRDRGPAQNPEDRIATERHP
jgi:hypothetical protein